MTTLSLNPVKIAPNANPYTGPDVPTTYTSSWMTYTNLTAAQIAWFQSQPQDLLKYAIVRHGYYLTVIAPSVTASQAPALISALATEAQNTINAIVAATPTITTRAQIDAALAAIATANNTPSI